MTGSRYEVSLQTYETLVKRYNLTDTHPILGKGPVWHSPAENHKLASLADIELNQRGLLNNGQLDPTFVKLLQLLQTSSVEYYTSASISDKETVIRVTHSQREALLSVSTLDSIALFPSHPDMASRDLVARLPQTPAARLQSLSCALDDYQLVASGKVSTNSNSSLTDARQINRWLKGPRKSYGWLNVAVRDQWGARKQSKDSVKWLDTPSGRVMTHLDSKDWLNLSGASPQDIVDKLNQLRAQLT